MAESFKDLMVYQKAFSVSLEIIRETEGLPKNERYDLIDQIRRASRSICANLAEGFGRQKNSKADFKRFIIMAYGSCQEMLVWIDYCKELNYLTNSRASYYEERYIEISKMLQSFHSKI